MPGRTEAQEADGEWSDASDDAVKSGSATDASKTEGDDTVNSRSLGLGRPSLMALSSSSSALGRKDPVHSVLDKIDAELAAMSSLPAKGGKGSARLSTTCRPKSSLPPLLTTYNTLFPEKGGSAKGPARKGGSASDKEEQHIAGSAEIYTDATLTDDDARATQATEDFLSDLDSVVAQQIDSRFKEIMLKKKGTTTPPPPSSSSHPPGRPTTPILTLSPPTPLSTYLDTSPLNKPPSETSSQTPRLLPSTGYGTDNDSIKTEDFESRFQNLIITDGNTSGESAKKSRQKRAKNSNGRSSSSSLKKAGLGSGFGSGASPSVVSAKPVAGGGGGNARGGGGVGKVSFDVSSKEKDDAPGSSSLKLNGLNRVLQHSMKSLGETSVKEPVESTSSALASLPPSGRSRSVSPERLTVYHPRLYPGLHRSPDYGPARAHPAYPPPGWGQEPWHPDPNGPHPTTSTGSSRSTFEEVESLCLSRSSADSFGQFHNAQRHGSRNPHPPPTTHGRGPAPGGRLLSRQSSTTSTSTSSGNLAEHLERRSGSTSTSGSVHEDAMETLDPRQQFDLHDHNLLDGIFRRVLEWNNAHAALGVGRGGSAAVPFPQTPPGSYPQRFYPPGYGLPPPPPPPGGNGVNPYTRPVPVVGQRVPDVNKDKSLSPTSDITHVKKRRDLILPDEEEDFSFNRSCSRNPDGSPRVPGKPQSSSSGGTSSFSSKLASSDSWLSSSSLSQSQDLHWREQYASGEARPSPWREHFNPGWGDPYAAQWGADPHHSMWRDPPPFSGPPPMMPPGYNMPSSRMNRGLSMDSMNSYGISSPPDAFGPSQYVPPPRQNTAEMMLMNLGFGGSSEGFLPERFLKDWYNKVSRAQSQAAVSQSAAAGSAHGSPHGSESNLHHPRGAKAPLNSKPSYEDLRSASDLHRRITNHLSRAATISTSPSHESSDPSMARLPSSLGSQSTTDRLKEYIEAHAHNVGNPPDARSQRIHQFASSRQKSLPSYLETLTEEEEVKGRGTAYKLQKGQSRLHTFLREDSFSSKSGSQNTSSGCTSNSTSQFGSESESASGSDYLDFSQKKRQSLFTSREQPAHVTTSQPAPVIHRLLTLKKQASLDMEQEQSQSDLKLPENIGALSSPKKKHKQGQRSRHNSPKHQADSSQQDPSANLGVHLNVQKGSSLDSPSSKCKSPKKERRAKSPDPRNKSPSHRPRSPRHQRGRSPFKELKPKTTHDDVLRAKAPNSSFDDSSSSSSSRRKKASSSGNIKLPTTDDSRGSPNRKQPTSFSTPSTENKPSDQPADEPNENQSLQRETECLPKSPQTPLACSINTETEKQEKTADPRSERTEPLVSTESLEVADIFQVHNACNSVSNRRVDKPSSEPNSSAGRGKGELEPAMISIVLEDVDGNLTESGLSVLASDYPHDEPSVQLNEESHPHEELLHLPSCSSSLSVSPIPMSPVTVIEVSLDNQQDSIDTEEGTSSSKDLTEDGDLSGVDSDTVQTLTDILSEDTDPGEFPVLMNFGPDRYMSGSLPLLQCPSSVNSQALQQTCDVGIEADDGSTSPLLMLNDASPLMSSSSSSSSPSVVGQSSNLSEIGIQSDDGRLTPLVLLKQDETLSAFVQNSVTEDLYLVSDQGVQCGGEVTVTDTQSQIDYIAEAPLLEMAHKITQTNRKVIYEMSSQTETSIYRSSSTSSSKAKSPPQWGSEFFNSSTDCHFDSKNRRHVTKKNCHMAQHEMFSPVHDLPLTHYTSKGLHKLSQSFSFESEFWDFMGIQMPRQLQKFKTSLNRQQCTSYGSDVLTADRTVHDQCRTSLPHKTHSPNKASASAVLQDEVHFHSPHYQKKLSTPQLSPGFQTHFNRHGTMDRRSPDRLSNSGMASSLPERCSHSDSSHLCMCSGSESKSRGNDSGFSPMSKKHQSVNTHVSVPPDESDSTRVPEKLQCSFVKPFVLDQSMPKHNPFQEEESCTQLHVSVLSFSVGDYRDLNGESPSPNNSWNLKTDSDQHDDSNAHKGLALATKSEMSQSHAGYRKDLETVTCNEPATEPNELVHQSCVCHSVVTKQQSPKSLTKKQNGPYDFHDEIHNSGSTSQGSLLDSKVEQTSPLRTAGQDSKTSGEIQRMPDKDMVTKEEARKLVMQQFLLRSPAHSGSKLSDSSAQTATDAKQTMHDCMPSFEHKKDYPENEQVMKHGSDDEKAKVLSVFKLREPSVKSEMPCGSLQYFVNTPKCNDKERHPFQESGKEKDTMLMRTRITETEAASNCSLDFSPPQEQAAHILSMNLCTGNENSKDHKKEVENEFCLNDCKSNAAENAHSLSEKDNRSTRTSQNNPTLDDRQSWLLETFAHSVIESACHELQKTYLKNKQKLRERMQGELKLTGFFAADAKDKHCDTSEETVTIRTDKEVALENDCNEMHTKHSEEMSTGSGVFTDNEDGAYPEETNTHTPSLDCEKPRINAVPDIKAELPIFSHSSLCEIPVALEVQSAGYCKNEEDNHLPVQIVVESEDNPIMSQDSVDSTGEVSHFELQVQCGDSRLRASRCLSSDSFNSLSVNFSGSTEDINDDVEAEDAVNRSQSLQSDSDDEMPEVPVFEPETHMSPEEVPVFEPETHMSPEEVPVFEPETHMSPEEVPVFEPETPMPPEEEDCRQNVTVIDTSQSLSCSCSDGVYENGLPDFVLDQQKKYTETQNGSIDDDLNFLEPENWFSNTIDLDGSEGEPSNTCDIHENQFESLLFLDSNMLQDAYEGYGLVGYLPRIAEESENLDQINEQPDITQIYTGGVPRTLNTNRSNSSSETQSSEKSSVELSSEETEFGIEVSLQPLPATFDVDQVTITCLDEKCVLTKRDTLTEQVKEDSDKGSRQLSGSSQSPSAAACHSLEDPSLGSPFWRVEQKELESPDLLTKSDMPSVKTDCEETKPTAIHTTNAMDLAKTIEDDKYLNSETENDREIACILQGEIPLDPSVTISVFPSSVCVSDQAVENGSCTGSVSNKSHITNQTGKETDVIQSTSSVNDQSLDTEETRLSTGKKEPPVDDIPDSIDSNSSSSERVTSSPSPKLIRFQRSISKESDTSDQSPQRTTEHMTVPSPDFRGGASSLLHVPQTMESLVSKNALLRLCSSSSESDQTSQPRSHSPVPETSSPSGLQSPVCGQSPSLEECSHQSPTLASPNSLSPIPNVVLSSENKSIQLFSVTSSRETSCDRTSPLSEMSDICLPASDYKVSKSHLTDDDSVFVMEQSTAPATASCVNQSANGSDDSSRSTFSPASETEIAAISPSAKGPENRLENPADLQHVSLSIPDKDKTSVLAEIHEPSHLPQLQTEFSNFESPSKAKLTSLPKRSDKTLSPSRTMSSSGDESTPLQFTLSRTYYPSESVTQPQGQPGPEVEKKSSSSESPIPSTPSLSRDPSSTSDSSSSIRDKQSVSLQRFQPATTASVKTSFVHDSVGSCFVITGTVNTNHSNTGDKVDSALVHNETDLLKYTDLPEKDCKEMNQSLSSSILQSSSPQQHGSRSSSTTSAVSPKPRSLAPLQLRRSRFQNMSNTMSAFERSSSSEHGSADNSATPKRRFFWSTDQKTVVSPVHKKPVTSPGMWLATGNSQSHSSRNSNASSLSDESGKEDFDRSSDPSARHLLPLSVRELDKSDLNTGNTIKSFVFSNSARRFGGSSSDLERPIYSKQLRVSPTEHESKSDSEIHLSPTTGHMSINRVKKESPRRSVRELAKQFEKKWK